MSNREPLRSQHFKPVPILRRIQVFFINIDFPLLLMVGLLGLAGVLTLYSASDVFPSRFDAQLRNWVLAMGVAIFVAQIKPVHLQQLALPLYLVGVLLLLAVEFFGETRKGATRWLNLGVTSIQPSELMKMAMPIMLAWWFHQKHKMQPLANLLMAAVILIVPVLLIMHEPDLGTALLVLVAGVAVIFFAGLSWKFVIPPVLLLFLGIIILVSSEQNLCQTGKDWWFLHDYQVKRICTLLDPYRDPTGAGYHIIQSTIAIGSGGLTGQGFMQGTQTHLNFIPEGTTDFIFAVYAEEFGLFGNGLLLMGFVLLIFRGFVIAARAETLFARLLACGITVIFFVCSFVNIGMVSGVLPVVGVPLPFMSYGGTALVTFGLGIGILMSISGDAKLCRKEKKALT